MLPPCHSIAATANGEPATASAVIKETLPRLSSAQCLQLVVHSLAVFWGNVPLLRTSMYVIVCDSVLPCLPPH